jgi:hypothetical protein
MEHFHNGPRDELGVLSLSKMYCNKLEHHIVQEMIQNSKTLELLKQWNDGEIFEEFVKE